MALLQIPSSRTCWNTVEAIELPACGFLPRPGTQVVPLAGHPTAAFVDFLGGVVRIARQRPHRGPMRTAAIRLIASICAAGTFLPVWSLQSGLAGIGRP